MALENNPKTYALFMVYGKSALDESKRDDWEIQGFLSGYNGDPPPDLWKRTQMKLCRIEQRYNAGVEKGTKARKIYNNLVPILLGIHSDEKLLPKSLTDMIELRELKEE